MNKWLCIFIVLMSCEAAHAQGACTTVGTSKLFFAASNSFSSASGTEDTTTTMKTAKLASTWFQTQSSVANTTSAAADSTTPNNKGWFDAGTGIGNCKIPAGTWVLQSSMSDSSGSQTSATLSFHIYTFNTVSLTFTHFCDLSNAATSMSTTATVRSATGSCPDVPFNANDELYVELYFKTGSTNSSASTTATTTFRQLGTNDFITFPASINVSGGTAPACTLATLGVGAC